MFEELRIKNFGCLRDVTARLTPLHAFIGPNDTGKSTLLEAARFVGSCLERHREIPTGYLPRTPREASTGPTVLAVTTSESDRFTVLAASPLKDQAQTTSLRVQAEDERALGATVGTINGGNFNPGVGKANRRLIPHLRGARLTRLDPDALREPSGLIPEGSPVTFDERGRGLPGVYDAILSRGDGTYDQIAARVRSLFPAVARLRLKAVSEGTKALEVELQDKKRIGAGQMSEGLLYFLAYAALPYVEDTSLILVEEPENGLHPARIAQVMQILREVTASGKTQVLIATHSPLVVNELRPEEVTVVTRSPETGTKLTPMAETPHFAERAQVYALGELWLAYANGDDEAPLLRPREDVG